MSEDEERAAVVAEARSWVGTPYGEGAKVKGAGIDCGQFLIQVYARAGLIEDFDTGYYSPQHHLHSTEERYLSFVMERAREIPGPPGPGDMVMFKFGKVFSHGAIVIAWPKIVHALRLDGTTLDNVERCVFGRRGLANLPRKYFTLWGS